MKGPDKDTMEFVVGAEHRLAEIVGESDVLPLLQEALNSGAARAFVTDAQGKVLWSCGTIGGDVIERLPLFIEGEEAGFLVLEGAGTARGASGVIHHAIGAVIHANLKRMLTCETHTTVVNRSYEELLETNTQLRASEARYRELAEHLEEKVKERTEELKWAHARLLQQEKMASIGQLAAGVAHEINNPMGFITSNLNTMKTYMERCSKVLQSLRSLMDSGHIGPDALEELRPEWTRMKLDHVLEDADILIQESLEGAGRVKKIVSDLKGVSHIDDGTRVMVDLNAEIDMILNLLSHYTPPGTKITRDFQVLPQLSCRAALISQGFTNIIVNALQARKDGLEIVISTRSEKDRIVVSIADNGPGIPDEIINRIFEPFFTTREVGKGMGLGLTIAYDIVTSHGGTIEAKGKNGASFTVKLPLRQ